MENSFKHKLENSDHRGSWVIHFFLTEKNVKLVWAIFQIAPDKNRLACVPFICVLQGDDILWFHDLIFLLYLQVPTFSLLLDNFWLGNWAFQFQLHVILDSLQYFYLFIVATFWFLTCLYHFIQHACIFLGFKQEFSPLPFKFICTFLSSLNSLNSLIMLLFVCLFV